MERSISKQAIRFWLDNYHALKVGDRPSDLPPSNSGPKPQDGISEAWLSLVMLDDAIKKLPEELRRVVHFRWIARRPLRETAANLGISSSKSYYKRGDQAVAAIYKIVNGNFHSTEL